MPAEVFSMIKDSTFYIQEVEIAKKSDRADTLTKVELLDINVASKEDLIELKGI